MNTTIVTHPVKKPTKLRELAVGATYRAKVRPRRWKNLTDGTSNPSSYRCGKSARRAMARESR